MFGRWKLISAPSDVILCLHEYLVCLKGDGEGSTTILREAGITVPSASAG